MKVGELRKQGWNAIQGDVLTNGLSERIVLSYNGAFAVNNGHHDDLEIVDLLWRVGSPPDSFRGTVEYTLESWRPDFGSLSNAAKQYKDDTQCFGENVPKVPSNCVEVPAKPIFTQVMADAGEFPPIGSDFRTDGDEDCDDGYCYLRCVAHHIDGGVIGQDDSARMFWVMAGAMALDNRTPKQKAVDAAIAEWPLLDKATLECAYDLWAQKIEQ